MSTEQARDVRTLTSPACELEKRWFWRAVCREPHRHRGFEPRTGRAPQAGLSGWERSPRHTSSVAMPPRQPRSAGGGAPAMFRRRVRIFSGIQPTGRKHLGNYIGAIRHYVEGQERGEGLYCIVDLHALTLPYEPAELRERLHDTLAILLAAGLDPARSVLFRQSDVHEHTELSWLLSCVTPLGELNRMHQFRDKSQAQRELVSAGPALLSGPHGGRRARLPRRRGARGGGPARAPRAHARRRAPLQRPLRRGPARRPRGPDPRGRRADHGPPGADPEDVDDGRVGGGHALRPRRAAGDREEAQARGDRLRHGDPARSGASPASRTSSTSSRSPAGRRRRPSRPTSPRPAATATSRPRRPRP